MRFRLAGSLALLLATTAAGLAQSVDSITQTQTIPLWSGKAPGALGDEERDKPSLTVYRPRPAVAVGTAVIVAPGGGYRSLAANHEGRQIANWLNALGVTAFVLTYRLSPRYHHPIQLGDAQRAMRLVRARAVEFGVLPQRVGMIGFSAGGHLAATAATHFNGGNAAASDPVERVSSRPDFLILGYALISFTAGFAHKDSPSSLLGANPDAKLLTELSNELHVSARTPPTFLFHTSADRVVPVEHSVAFYLALQKAGVAAELHVFAEGPHGVGLGLQDAALGAWPTLLTNWLRARGLLTKLQR